MPDNSIVLHDPGRIRLLYVEDNGETRTAVTAILKRRYPHLYLAGDGAEGVDAYRRYRPDIIVTDIRMPVMNGLEMIRAIREYDRFVPIIVLSAHNESEMLMKAIDANVDAYVLKPVKKHDLLDKIDRCTQNLSYAILSKTFRLLTEQTANGFMIIANDGRILYVNPALAASVGLSLDAIYTAPLINDDPYSPCGIARDVWERLTNGESHTDIRTVATHGQQHYLERTLTPLRNDDGTISHIVFTTEDVTVREARINGLKLEADHDTMTGALRRSVLEKTIADVERQSTERLFVMMDIDHFKSINDSFGHHAGDRVIRQFARIASSQLRSGDFLFRWGGEEFLLLILDLPPDKVFDIVERIRQQVEMSDFDLGRPVTVSCGIARQNDGESWDAAIRRADDLLYKAKHGGRNRTHIG